MRQLFSCLLLGGSLLALAAPARAQEGGQPVRPSATTRYVFQGGAVVQQDGRAITPLSGNIRLPNGTKVNYKSGIVELPGGKITTLHEGDYVKADGGIVFATPGSAATARGDESVPKDAKYSTYVLRGTEPSDPSRRIILLNQKIELLNQKISILSRSQPATPETTQLDQQIQELDAQMMDK